MRLPTIPDREKLWVGLLILVGFGWWMEHRNHQEWLLHHRGIQNWTQDLKRTVDEQHRVIESLRQNLQDATRKPNEDDPFR